MLKCETLSLNGFSKLSRENIPNSVRRLEVWQWFGRLLIKSQWDVSLSSIHSSPAFLKAQSSVSMLSSCKVLPHQWTLASWFPVWPKPVCLWLFMFALRPHEECWALNLVVSHWILTALSATWIGLHALVYCGTLYKQVLAFPNVQWIQFITEGHDCRRGS